MSDVLSQIANLSEEELKIDEDIEENDEWSTPFEVKYGSMDKEAKKAILKELIAYSNTEEFKKLKREAKKDLEDNKKLISDIAYTREEVKNNKSIIDEYVMIVNTLKSIAKHVTNEVFKDYLVEHRIASYDSTIVNKKGFVDRHQSMIPVDAPVYSDLDILKEKSAVLNSVGRFLVYCVDYFDTEWILQEKTEQKNDSYQPYE